MHEYTKSSAATIIVIANQYKMDSNAHFHRCQLYILQHNPNEATFHGDKAAIKAPVPSRVSPSNDTIHIEETFGSISSLVTLSVIDVEGLLAFLDIPVVLSLILALLDVIALSHIVARPEYKVLLLAHCLELLTGACDRSAWAFAFSWAFLAQPFSASLQLFT